MIRSACQLLAIAELGEGQLARGERHCFYCGADCNDSRSTAEYVKHSFTDWPSVQAPASEYVCVGCELATQEKAEINGRSGQKRRNYSWLITAGRAVALTKANLPELRTPCFAPPEPPWALAIAASGQKQLLYRTPVNYDRELITVQLETERVTFRPAELAERYAQAEALVPGLGKTKLLDGYWPTGLVLRLASLYPDADQRLDRWRQVCGEPLSRLAAFLVPGKEAAE